MRSAAPSLRFERELIQRGFERVAGVDEVGRGSWAGPLVAAAVVLPSGRRSVIRSLSGIADSKQLSAQERVAAFQQLRGCGAVIAVGWVSHHVVDSAGLAAANRRAMLRAVQRLPQRPDALLLDHFALPECSLPQTCVAKGDSLCLSVAAASVVAKVVRDEWMRAAERRYPGYGFAAHKGYGTAEHQHALVTLGPCHLHRASFEPIARLLT